VLQHLSRTSSSKLRYHERLRTVRDDDCACAA
jgi:hypothetical protein